MNSTIYTWKYSNNLNYDGIWDCMKEILIDNLYLVQKGVILKKAQSAKSILIT